MSVQAYANYRESGLPWLDEVPSHWITNKVKHTYKFTTGWTPPSGHDDYYGGDNLWANISDLGNRFIGDTAKRISDLAVRECNMEPSPEGSLLFSFKLSIGQMSFTSVPMFTNEAIASFQPDAAYSLQFAYYAFPIYIVANASENIYGAKMLNQELIKSAPICLPSLKEQTAIAIFLDRETAKIDVLVAEQERLIELLKEKRQAVISHAVTKGLNPDAPMKDSGIEWLGEIPAHWEASKIKFGTSHVVDCLHTTPTYDGELLYPAVRTADIDRGILLLGQARLVSQEIYDERIQRLRPQTGDVLYSREGERFGMAALVPAGTDLCLGQRMMMFRCNDEYSSGYLMWALNSDSVYQQVISDLGGATSPHVNISDVVNFAIPRPSRDEQQIIAAEITRRTLRLDALVTQAQSAITLLQERRAALISAAVTGKIDVRGLVETTKEMELA